MEEIRCCICNKIINGDNPDYIGNSPVPMVTGFSEECCCDYCNENYVIRARLMINELWKEAREEFGEDAVKEASARRAKIQEKMMAEFLAK